MNTIVSPAFDPRQLRRATGLIFALWMLAVASSMVWDIHLLRGAMSDAVERDARNSFDRDVLYLMNPDNMTSEMHELKAREDGTLGHITSLKPMRPENAPDAWEAAALRTFEQGRTEASSRDLLHGQPYLRFMKPLVTDAGCLKCHAAQRVSRGRYLRRHQCRRADGSVSGFGAGPDRAHHRNPCRSVGLGRGGDSLGRTPDVPTP